MQKSSLVTTGRQQLRIAQAAASGRSASTVYGGQQQVLRQTVVALLSGQRLDEHSNPGEATLYVLEGRVRLAAASESWEGTTGDLIVVPDATHSLEALEDAIVLLTVAKHEH